MRMDDWPADDLAALAPEVDVTPARREFDRRRRRWRQRRRAILTAAAITIVLVGIGALTLVVGGNEPDTMTDTPAPGSTSPTNTVGPTTTPGTVAVTSAAPTTVTTATAPTVPWSLRPLGVSSDDPSVRIRENNIVVQDDDGNLELTYQLQLGFFALDRSGVVETAAETTDTQLSIAVTCEFDDCSFQPRNDSIQTSLELTVRTTQDQLTAGIHRAPFAIRFDDGDVIDFDVQFYAQPAPSADMSTRVASSSGEPAIVQRVFDVGRFPYHIITAFDSIWVLGQASSKVTRIDATTGALLATIPLAPPGSRIQSNRLTAGDNYVYAAGTPVVRIDPIDNTATPIDNGTHAFGVIADHDTVWAAGRDTLQRIEPDGTITALDVPQETWMDLAWSNELVWALAQRRGTSTLLAIDGYSGQIQHDIKLELGDAEYPVRLVADQDIVVVGTDSGGGTGTGRLLVFDPTTGSMIVQVDLNSRPEGIALSPEHIWTSSAIVDRATFQVQLDNRGFGFSITRGPDGSIWGTGAVPGSDSNDGNALRWSTGDYAN
jgi:hypothetical protein